MGRFGARLGRRDVHDAQRVRLREECAPQVVDPLHSVDHEQVARPLEAHMHDIPFGGAQHDALHPLFSLERAHVGADHLHADGWPGSVEMGGLADFTRLGAPAGSLQLGAPAGTCERQVERARIGHVGQVEAHDLAGFDRELVVRLAVDEHEVAEAPHERVGRALFAKWHDLVARHQKVVEHDDLFSVCRRVVVGMARLHQHVPVEAQVLQHVLAMMRMIPIDARVLEEDLVAERLAWLDRLLGDAGHAVGGVVEAEAVPVDRGGPRHGVREVHGDGRGLRHVKKRSRVLAVECVHDVIATPDATANQAGLQGYCVAVFERNDLAWTGEGKGGRSERGRGGALPLLAVPTWLACRHRQERGGIGRVKGHEGREHGETGHHWRTRPPVGADWSVALVAVTRHCHVRGDRALLGVWAAFCCSGAVALRPRGADEELLHVRRRHPRAGRRRTQHESAFPLRRIRPRFSRDEDHELVQADLADASSAVRHRPQVVHNVEERRGQPGDEVLVLSEGLRFGEFFQSEHALVEVIAGNVDGDAERAGRRAQLQSSAGRLQARSRCQEHAVEVAAGEEGGACERRSAVTGGRGKRRPHLLARRKRGRGRTGKNADQSRRERGGDGRPARATVRRLDPRRAFATLELVFPLTLRSEQARDGGHGQAGLEGPATAPPLPSRTAQLPSAWRTIRRRRSS